MRGKMTANYSGYTYCGNSWWTRDDLMADRSVRQRKRPATDEAPRPRRRKPTPKVQQHSHHPPSPVVDESTPLADYWLENTEEGPAAARAGGAARAGAGADGRAGRTQKSVGRRLLHGRGLLGRSLHGRAHGVRIRCAGRRPTIAKTTVEPEGRASLRVAQLMEGLNAHQFDPHASRGLRGLWGEVEGAEAVEEEEKAAACRVQFPDVAFLCDLHAHLCDAEIIGLLGGRWDPGDAGDARPGAVSLSGRAAR